MTRWSCCQLLSHHPAAAPAPPLSPIAIPKMPFMLLRGGIRTVMITGEIHHTAIAVAKQISMIQPDQDVVVIDVVNQKDSVSDESARHTSSSASPLSYLAPSTASDGLPLSGLQHQYPAPLHAWRDRLQGSESMAGGQGGE